MGMTSSCHFLTVTTLHLIDAWQGLLFILENKFKARHTQNTLYMYIWSLVQKKIEADVYVISMCIRSDLS